MRLLSFPALRRVAPVLALIGLPALAAAQGAIIPTTARAFDLPGTQPGTLTDFVQGSYSCSPCHGYYDPTVAPYDLWAGSMMAQSARDPIFYAAMSIANQDAADSGYLCLRCHSPVGFLEGRALPADGSGLDNNQVDFDGVNCHFCHRLVDPVYDAENPAVDQGILAALTSPPGDDAHTGQYVVDPVDLRRGPFDLGPGFGIHDWALSPHHRESQLCATCHDVSNPAFELRQTGVGYKLTNPVAEHPTHVKTDYFPIERTFSEWLNSVYAITEIETNGRFGGDHTAVASCQDCHMPTTNDTACMPGLGEVRPDMPLHHFNGANSWVLEAVRLTFPDFETGLTDQIVDDSLARNVSMLQRSADLEAFVRDGELRVRVVNHTGHKLPTGYGEGRRMWLTVRFYDAGDNLVSEHGHYDDVTADLDTASTKVYEIHQGLDSYMANQTGLPAGESFHFVLNNTVVKDNRIPARGFTDAAYRAAQADVVAYAYDDQHHWDDTAFALPAGAVRAEVELLHQTTSKEYIDFLKNENTTDTRGQEAWDLWNQLGRSAPVLMGAASVDLAVVDCATPVVYGLGLERASGGFPDIAWTGSPSYSSNDLELQLSGGAPNQLAVLFGSQATASIPHLGGTLLVATPQVRLATVTLDGTGAASVPVPVTPGMVGTSMAMQWIYRDLSAPGGAGMTAGLFVDFCD